MSVYFTYSTNCSLPSAFYTAGPCWLLLWANTRGLGSVLWWTCQFDWEAEGKFGPAAPGMLQSILNIITEMYSSQTWCFLNVDRAVDFTLVWELFLCCRYAKDPVRDGGDTNYSFIFLGGFLELFFFLIWQIPCHALAASYMWTFTQQQEGGKTFTGNKLTFQSRLLISLNKVEPERTLNLISGLNLISACTRLLVRQLRLSDTKGPGGTTVKIYGNWNSRGSSLFLAGIIVPFATASCVAEELCFRTGLARLEKPVSWHPTECSLEEKYASWMIFFLSLSKADTS